MPATTCVRWRRPQRASAGDERFGGGRHRLVGQPMLQVIGQVARRGVAICPAAGPSPSGRSLRGPAESLRLISRGRGKLPAATRSSVSPHIRADERRAAGEQHVERRAEAVHIARGPDIASGARRLARGS